MTSTRNCQDERVPSVTRRKSGKIQKAELHQKHCDFRSDVGRSCRWLPSKKAEHHQKTLRVRILLRGKLMSGVNKRLPGLSSSICGTAQSSENSRGKLSWLTARRSDVRCIQKSGRFRCCDVTDRNSTVRVGTEGARGCANQAARQAAQRYSHSAERHRDRLVEAVHV